jgi:protein-S-isoprenylcysteine O-methyltransferase Ste14
MKDVLRRLDWPPVWTAAAVAAAWVGSAVLPWGILGPAGPLLGGMLVLAGLSLMGVAAAQMVAARTTVIPRRAPSRLVTGGVFALSRNPIYLGDALVVAGACLWFQVPWALPMVAAFVWVIETRFIRGEEVALEAAFGPEFRLWAQRTRRWIGGSYDRRQFRD